METSIDKILSAIRQLDRQKQLEVLREIEKMLDLAGKQEIDVKALDGLGKEIWKDEDGQEYVNRLRKEWD